MTRRARLALRRQRRGAACGGHGARSFRARCCALEGFADSVDYRAGRLLALLGDFGAKSTRWTERNSRALWRADPRRRIHRRAARTRDLARQPRAVAGGAVRRAASANRALAHFYDWGGGLVWLATRGDARPRRRRAPPRCVRLGGHATLVRAPDALRAARRRVRAAFRAGAAAQPGHQGELRSGRRPQLRPHVRGGVRQPMQTNFSARALADPHIAANSKASCAPASIAASAPRPARPTVSSATSATARAGASISSRTCSRTSRSIEAEDVRPIDHCLSCLSCMTTCPSGVDYHASRRSCARYDRGRPTGARSPTARMRARAWRGSSPSRSAFAPRCGSRRLGRPLAPLARPPAGDRRRSSTPCSRSPRRASARGGRPRSRAFSGRRRRRRRAAASRCSAAAPQAVLAPQINAATIRLLNRAGIDVVLAEGRRLLRLARPSHGPRGRGRSRRRAPTSTPGRARSRARASTRSSSPRRAAARRSRTTATCCATIRLMRRKPRASRRSPGTSREVADALDLDFRAPRPLAVAYHAACSLQHGQKIVDAPKALLRRAGFDVRVDPRSAPLLRLGRDLQHPAAGDRRGSARPQGRQHRARQARRHRRRQHRLPDPDRLGDRTPVVHTVELLDWASGGPAAGGAWLDARLAVIDDARTVIASEAKQSRRRRACHQALDCFASLPQ